MSSVTQQQVPEGYQRTEVGVIPNDWKVISIDRAITERLILDQMDGNHGELYPKSYEFSDSGVPYVGATDFDGGSINFKNCKYLPEKRAAIFKKGVAKDGDVLFAHNATVGPVALVETALDYIILSTTATYYRCDNKSLINNYLKAYFESEYFVGQYTAVMSQSTRNQVPILAQRKFLLVIPSVEEQTAIAKVLSDVDALITSLEKLIAKKRAIKTAAMQQLLTGKKRLPPFDKTHTGYKQAELGEIPEDWEVVTFDALKDPRDRWGITGGPFGSNLKSSDYTESGVRIIQLQNIGDGMFLDDYKIYTSKTKADELISCNIYPREILLSKMGDPVARACIIPRDESRYVMCSDGIRLKVDETKYNPFFIYTYINAVYFRKQAFEASTGSTRQRIGLTELRQLLLVSPDVEEQAAIAGVLYDMDSEIDVLEERLNKTHQIKQGMMQELLTGRTRLV